jgi:hypothetical protein
MHNAKIQPAWAQFIKRDQTENRVAFVAALLMERVPLAQSKRAIEKGDDFKLRSHIAEGFAVELSRLARAIKRHAENACNREVSEAEEARDAKNQARFAAIASALGFEARTGGDPRGACAYLIDPDDRKGDGWGEGWAVY